MLDDMVGKLFWCIRPTMLREFERNPGPMIPYQGELVKGPGLDSWFLVPCLHRVDALTKNVGLQTIIHKKIDLFVDRTSACSAYITEQTGHIKELEKNLKQEGTTLLDFVLTETNKFKKQLDKFIKYIEGRGLCD